MIDILLENAMIITVDSERRVFLNGAIAMKDGEILEVGPSDALSIKYEAATTLDGTDMIAMPGMINCHMHLPQMLMRGINDDIEVMDKLKGYIWPIQGHYDEQGHAQNAE